MRHAVLVSTLLLVLFTGTAFADRLGGAFRGLFEDADGDGGLGRGGVPAREVMAYWGFYYEHNKEWLLAERLTARRTLARGESGLPGTRLVDRVFAVLSGALPSPVSQVRDAAIIALGKTGRAKAIPLLAKRLGDLDHDVREDTLLALGLLRHPDARPYLIMSLFDEGLRPWAALGLALAKDMASLPMLLELYAEALEDADFTAAEQIATAIGHLVSEKDDIDALAAPLWKEHRLGVKGHICQALAVADTDHSRKLLLRAAEGKDRSVNAAAILALASPRNLTESRLFLGNHGRRSPDRMTALYAIRGLAAGTISKDHRKQIIKVAGQVRRDLYKAQYAALSLGLAGCADANDSFIEALTADYHWMVEENRAAMMMALGLTGDRRATNLLFELHRKGTPHEAGHAALALALLHCRDELVKVRKLALKTSPRWVTAYYICWALGLAGTEADVPYLMSVLTRVDDDWLYARGAAATALGLIAADSSVEPLLELAENSKDPSTQAFAIVALGWMVDRDPVPRIPLLYRNLNYRLRRYDKVYSAVMSRL